MTNENWRTFTAKQYTDAMESMVASRTAVGREKWGGEFVGDPLDEAEQEALDLCYYLYVARRQRLWLKTKASEPKSEADLQTLAFNEFAHVCHAQAERNGWHDQPRSFGEEVALIHSEVSEALEEYRETGDVRSPEVVEELADIIIRVADVVGKHDIDIEAAIGAKMAKNSTRPYRHGGKHL